jgi:nucleoid-associated protein YgaU
MYEDTLQEKEVEGVLQYTTPQLKHITKEQIPSLTVVSHVWKTGDRFYKLAYDHYGDSTKWWVIAWYNRRPTENHMTFGEIIYIPHPLEQVLTYLGV